MTYPVYLILNNKKKNTIVKSYFTLEILNTGTGLNVDRQLDLQVAYNTYVITFIYKLMCDPSARNESHVGSVQVEKMA